MTNCNAPHFVSALCVSTFNTRFGAYMRIYAVSEPSSTTGCIARMDVLFGSQCSQNRKEQGSHGQGVQVVILNPTLKTWDT